MFLGHQSRRITWRKRSFYEQANKTFVKSLCFNNIDNSALSIVPFTASLQCGEKMATDFFGVLPIKVKIWLKLNFAHI